MSLPTEQEIRIHTHAGRVAFHTDNTPTVYLTPAMAMRFANQLTLAAKQEQNANHYPSTTLKEGE